MNYKVIAILSSVASAIFLYMAITSTIISTKMSSPNEFLEQVYTFEVFRDMQDDSSKATQDAYDKNIIMVQSLLNSFIASSEGAKKRIEELTMVQPYNVIEGITELYKTGDKIPAALILIFSVIFPVTKTIFALIASLTGSMLGLTKYIISSHKYTMLDVFVVSITVFALSNQDLVSVNPGISVFYYIIYMIISYIAFHAIVNMDYKKS